jgi:hypothetical protein
MCRPVFAIMLLAVSLLSSARAMGGTRCYEHRVSESPYGASPIVAPSTETWCYWELPESQMKMVYNADADVVKPELSALVKPDGSIVFGSLLKGEISVHVLNDGNPLPVPLDEPFRPSEMPLAPEPALEESAKKVLRFFLESRPESILFTLREGTHSVSVPGASMPWRGYWWPYGSRRLAYDRFNSPLAKYDRFVEALTGTNPGARSWELHNHASNVRWYGHCNGWAASSILRREPNVARVDPRTGVRFTISDQKGLLAEEDMCVKFRFVGRRYNGPGDDAWDIPADVFHKTIEEQIGFLRKPILMDHDRLEQVWNVVVSGYKMTMTRQGGGKWQVVTELTTHVFDNQMSDATGVAPIRLRTYRYELSTDHRGAVVSGRWLSSNPDFLWVPLSPDTCEGSNEKLDPTLVELIVDQLPAAR